MKKTLFKVIVYLFCVFSIVELYAEEGIDDLEKKNFFKIERLEVEIIALKNQYKLLSEEQSESEGELNLEMAFFKLNTKVNSLNDDILALKNQYELLTEEQRLNTQKITELFQIIELNTTKKQKTEKTIKTDKEKSAFKLYSDGKRQFALGNYEKAIE